MTGLTDMAFAIILGGGLGVGLLLLAAVVPRWGAPSLANRIAPYLRDITDPLGLTAPTALFGDDLRRGWTAIANRLSTWAGGGESVARRIAQAGWALEVAQFRVRQLIAALIGVGVGALIAVLLALWGAGQPSLVLLPVILGAVAAIGCDVMLTRAARARAARTEAELPTVLEFLALCLAAGEGLMDAVRRASEVGSGEFAKDLRAVVIETRTGSSLTEALTALAHRRDVPALSRSVDHIVAALDRGAPLAGVLHAQAGDFREDEKRSLIERAGRNEIVMLLPLVFLILPLSVLFAVFPGIFILRLGIG